MLFTMPNYAVCKEETIGFVNIKTTCNYKQSTT